MKPIRLRLKQLKGSTFRFCSQAQLESDRYIVNFHPDNGLQEPERQFSYCVAHLNSINSLPYNPAVSLEEGQKLERGKERLTKSWTLTHHYCSWPLHTILYHYVPNRRMDIFSLRVEAHRFNMKDT
jgi:hypothetical protein